MRTGNKLPARIYVKWEKDGDTRYLVATTSPVEFEDGDAVGVYGLLQVKTMSVKRTLK